MAEYAVKVKASRPGLFMERSVSDIEVVEADNAKEAIEKVREMVKKELRKHFISESSVSISIEDVKKI